MSVTNDATDTPKTDAPPRRRRRSSPTPEGSPPKVKGSQPGGEGTSASPPPRPTAGGRSLQSRLEEFFGSLALPYATMGDAYAANLIAQRAPAMAEAWADLAKQNAGIRRVLEKMLQGTAWGAVILSSASVAVPLLAHHGIIPIPMDPFAGMYGGEMTIPVRGRSNQMPGWTAPGPIVPEPPDSDDYMSPPIGEGSPPGVFTVAGSNNGATMPPGA